jgi:hypothetical protein
VGTLLPAPFIVGVPRSGTTLLRLQLDSHSDLAIPPETGLGDLLAGVNGAAPTRAELLDAITALGTWPDFGVTREELAEAFERAGRWSVADGVRAYYALYASSRGKSRYGDKTPGHARHMGAIAEALPEARFIHIIRDGRDVAASLRDLPFAPAGGDMAAIAALWRDTIWRARRIAETLPHYVEVRYERLVTEPEAVLRELCDFLELTFDPAMLEAHLRADRRLAELRTATFDDGVVRFGDGTEIATLTRRPPDPSRVGRWREVLSEHEVARFERFAGAALAAEGYAPYEHPDVRSGGARPAPAGRRTAMRIVLGRQSLGTLGGVATYAMTVAHELGRLGHDVTLGADELGQAADVARARGIRVVPLEELPSTADAVIAHDLPMAASLAERYPDARRVYVAHSDGWDLELPPLVPDAVHAVIACSDRMAARIRALALDLPIVRLREPVDTDAYLYVKALPERPRRALILSHYLRGPRREMLVDAWESAGVECVQAGSPTEVVVDLAPAFQSADIVVAKGRAALEGMCAGCAVYLYDQYGCDGWVTPDSYPAMEADHFGGQATPRPRTRDELAGDLAAYYPDMGVLCHELVRIHHGARHHAMELVAVLRGDYRRAPEQADVLSELARSARARARAESRMAELWSWATAAEARASEAEQRLRNAEAVLETRRARAGLAVGRVADRLRRRS